MPVVINTHTAVPHAMHMTLSRLVVRAWVFGAGALALLLIPLEGESRPQPVQEAPMHITLPSSNTTIDLRTPSTPVVVPPSPFSVQQRFEVNTGQETPSLNPMVRADVSRELAKLTAQVNVTRPSRESSQAAWQLGLIHLHGAGVAVNRMYAQGWFDEAARHVNWTPMAHAGVAWCHMSGCQGPPDLEKAAQALRDLHKVAPARANFLSWMLAQQTRPVTVARPDQTQDASNGALQSVRDDLLQAASRQGDAQANVELGIRAATANRLSDARRLFQSAVGKSPAASINLERLRSWESVLQDPVVHGRHGGGADLFARAQRLHRGVGGGANYAQAIQLYRQAAQQGSGPARAMLELIFSRPAPNGELNVVWMQQIAQLDVQSALPQLAPSTRPQLVRDPSPLFDLMDPIWQKQIQMTGI